MSRQIAHGAFRCVPLRHMGNLMVIGKPWKTIGGTWFLDLASKKNLSLELLVSLGNLGKPMGKHGSGPCGKKGYIP